MDYYIEVMRLCILIPFQNLFNVACFLDLLPRETDKKLNRSPIIILQTARKYATTSWSLSQYTANWNLRAYYTAWNQVSITKCMK